MAPTRPRTTEQSPVPPAPAGMHDLLVAERLTSRSRRKSPRLSHLQVQIDERRLSRLHAGLTIHLRVEWGMRRIADVQHYRARHRIRWIGERPIDGPRPANCLIRTQQHRCRTDAQFSRVDGDGGVDILAGRHLDLPEQNHVVCGR